MKTKETKVTVREFYNNHPGLLDKGNIVPVRYRFNVLEVWIKKKPNGILKLMIDMKGESARIRRGFDDNNDDSNLIVEELLDEAVTRMTAFFIIEMAKNNRK